MNLSFLKQKTPAETARLLSSRIRDIRKRKKVSQIKLSEKSGVSLGLSLIHIWKGIARNEFEERLEKRIRLVADQYAPKRTAIWINSYPDDVDEAGKTSGRYLSFIDKFQGRNLKAEYDWNRDIYGEIKEFLLSRVNREQAYELYMAAHCSIAFAAGRLLNSKS